jgi:hypothetical protein
MKSNLPPPPQVTTTRQPKKNKKYTGRLAAIHTYIFRIRPYSGPYAEAYIYTGKAINK